MDIFWSIFMLYFDVFGSIPYILCETSLPKMAFLKNRHRSRLIDLRLQNTLFISIVFQKYQIKKKLANIISY